MQYDYYLSFIITFIYFIVTTFTALSTGTATYCNLFPEKKKTKLIQKMEFSARLLWAKCATSSHEYFACRLEKSVSSLLMPANEFYYAYIAEELNILSLIKNF